MPLVRERKARRDEQSTFKYVCTGESFFRSFQTNSGKTLRDSGKKQKNSGIRSRFP